MPLSFPIYLQSPFVMIEPRGDTIPYVSGNSFGQWGVITQTNPSSTFNVDNVVYYKSTDIPTIINTMTPAPPKGFFPVTIQEAFLIVDENNIMFINA